MKTNIKYDPNSKGIQKSFNSEVKVLETAVLCWMLGKRTITNTNINVLHDILCMHLWKFCVHYIHLYCNILMN